MGSLLAALTTLIVTVLAAALAAPYVLDWNQFKYVFEAQAGRLIGRPVRIEGDVGLTILPVPELRLKGLKIADEAGGFTRPFVEAENFSMVLSLPPLLSGTIEAREIEVDQPVVRFQLDSDGRGNWTTLTAPSGGVVPAHDLVLHNVIIKDGAFEYRRAPEAPATRIDQISGSFAADSLFGPYRFAGVGAIGRDKRDLKFSAGHVQKDGSLRLKASMTSASGASLYQLDGDLKNLGSAVQYTGPLLARLDLGAAVGGKGDKQARAPRPRAVELHAASTLTLQDARLQDIALTVTENDRPQSFTGSAYASWGGEPRLDLSVQTAFLDIDQMVGTPGGKTNPLAAIAALPQIFEGWAFDPREGKIKASIQQANLGGDIIEGVKFSAGRSREYWQVETLQARLPGDASLSIQGVLRPGERIGFTGEFNLSGRHLPRLLHWSAPSLGAVDTGDAQSFSLKSGLTFAEQLLTLRKASGQLGDSTFSGDLAYDYGANSRLMLTLQSDRLDLRSIYGGNPFASASAQDAAQQQAAAAQQTAAKTSLLDAFRTVFAAKQSQISLNIAQLTMPDLEARDVRSVFRYENGTFDIREFNLATSDGLSVKADGQLTDFESTPNGSINLALNAPSSASLANLAKLFGLESFGSAARRRMDALAPLKLTGSLAGKRRDRQLTLTLAGSASGSELTFSGRFDGDFNALKQAKVDLGGTIANADGRRLIAQLAPEAALSEKAGKSGAGVLTISAEGPLDGVLNSRLELRTPDAEGRFEGRIGLLDDPWSLKGDLWLRAGQASTALSMLRLSPGGAPVSGDLDVKAVLSKSASKLQIANINLQLGGQMVLGSANVDLSGERPVADIEARATAVMLPKLAAYLVDWDRKDLTAAAENLLSGNANLWPNQSFAFGNFGAVAGSLKLKSPAITLMDGMTLANGQFDVSLKGETLSVESLKGQLYGGTLTAGGTLAANEGRAVLNGSLKLDKADLAKLTAAGDGKPLAKGVGEFRLAFNGEGLSPRGLLTVLSGKGRVRLSKGALYGLAPAVLGQAADTYLAEEIPQQGRLVTRIGRDLRAPQGQLPFRGFIAPVVVKDGVLEIHRAGFKSPDALAAANLLVDLQSLKLDSEWLLSYRGKMKLAGELPPVRLVFAGPVSSFTRLQPQLQTESLERALSMQRMDRDMERLEKLNRQPLPGPQPSSTAPSRDPTNTEPSAAAPAAPPLPGVTAPTAQTFRPRAPSPVLPRAPQGAIPTRPTAAPVEPHSGWSTGVEQVDRSHPGNPPAGDTSNASATAKPRFEDEIRRVLQDPPKVQPQPAPPQPKPAPEAPAAANPQPRSGLSYQTQTYSQADAGIANSTDGAVDPAKPAPAEPVIAPLPERKPAAAKQLAKPPSALQDLLNLFN